MYFAGKLVYLIVLPSNQLAIITELSIRVQLESTLIHLQCSVTE